MKKCCGCCSVQLGTKIIAVLSIIGGSYIFIHVFLIAVAFISNPKEWIEQVFEDVEEKEIRNIVVAYFYENRIYVGLFMGGLMVRSAVEVILSGLLYYGASNNQVSLCLPWLYHQRFILCCFVVMSFLIFFKVGATIGYPAFTFAGISIILILYSKWILSVVNEYIWEIRPDSREDLEGVGLRSHRYLEGEGRGRHDENSL